MVNGVTRDILYKTDEKSLIHSLHRHSSSLGVPYMTTSAVSWNMLFVERTKVFRARMLAPKRDQAQHRLREKILSDVPLPFALLLRGNIICTSATLATTKRASV